MSETLLEPLAHRDAFADLDVALPGATLTASPASARLLLRGGADAAIRASAAFGLPILTMPRAATRNAAGSRALWLGPDEWLLIAPHVRPDFLFAEVAAALGGPQGDGHALFDVSDRQVGFALSGAKATTILAGGCPLDLDPSAVPVNSAARTLYLKAEIVLARDGEDVFHVEVLRSFLPYLLAHMRHAATGAP
jgi:sarcosine oxidase subunit gamma